MMQAGRTALGALATCFGETFTLVAVFATFDEVKAFVSQHFPRTVTVDADSNTALQPGILREASGSWNILLHGRTAPWRTTCGAMPTEASASLIVSACIGVVDNADGVCREGLFAVYVVRHPSRFNPLPAWGRTDDVVMDHVVRFALTSPTTRLDISRRDPVSTHHELQCGLTQSRWHFIRFDVVDSGVISCVVTQGRQEMCPADVARLENYISNAAIDTGVPIGFTIGHDDDDFVTGSAESTGTRPLADQGGSGGAVLTFRVPLGRWPTMRVFSVDGATVGSSATQPPLQSPCGAGFVLRLRLLDYALGCTAFCSDEWRNELATALTMPNATVVAQPFDDSLLTVARIQLRVPLLDIPSATATEAAMLLKVFADQLQDRIDEELTDASSHPALVTSVRVTDFDGAKRTVTVAIGPSELKPPAIADFCGAACTVLAPACRRAVEWAREDAPIVVQTRDRRVAAAVRIARQHLMEAESGDG